MELAMSLLVYIVLYFLAVSVVGMIMMKVISWCSDARDAWRKTAPPKKRRKLTEEEVAKLWATPLPGQNRNSSTWAPKRP